MPEISIDINCDIGERGITQSVHQLKFLDYVSSCNIATGFHAGDPYTIQRIIQKAIEKGVRVGVHPSYPDRTNFGRQSVTMTGDELYASMTYQTGAMDTMCTMAGTSLHHFKLHGALYHDGHHQDKEASVIIRFLLNWPKTLKVYGQNNSILREMADHYGIPWVSEAFADRKYQEDGRLVGREEEGGIIEDVESAVSQVVGIVRDQEVKSLSGLKVNIKAQTICIHGDHPGSLDLVRQLKSTLHSQGIAIKSP